MPHPAAARNREYYLFEGFPDLNLVCGFTTRILGNMSLDYGNTQGALENRKNFLNNLGIDYHDLVCAKQVHADKARYVREYDKGKGAIFSDSSISDTDAFITDEKNLPLAIFTADCLPIFLYDSKTSSIGLVHGGWRGTKDNIVSKAVGLMKEKFNTQPRDLYIGFGPSIRSCCYEVGREFSGFFPHGVIERNNRYYLDLAQINKKQLLELGVKEVNIFDSGVCTSCRNENFFSYRKEGNNCGRMMSVIMLTGNY